MTADQPGPEQADAEPAGTLTGAGPPGTEQVGAGQTGVDSREALLTAARQLFAARGFEGTTMRAVAARAQVDPALIYHYFPGGKRALLAATLTMPETLGPLLAGVGADPGRAGTELVRRALTIWDEQQQIREQGVALMRIGVGSEPAGDLIRTPLRSFILGLVGDALREDHRELRAGLVLAQMQGVLLHRYVLRLPPLATAPRDDLVAALGPVFQHYITGDLARLP